MKIIALFLSLFSLAFINNENDDVLIILDEECEYQEVNNKVFYLSDRLVFSCDIDEYVMDYVKEEHLIIYTIEDNVLIYRNIDNAGKIIKEEVIKENIINANVIRIEDVDYCFCTFQDLEFKDIIALSIKDGEIELEKRYNGKLNEEVIDCVYENSFYLVVYKDTLTDFDYGNGGLYPNSYELLKIDKTLNIEKIINFQNENYQDIDKIHFIDEQIAIMFSDALYLFDVDLNQKLGLKFASDSIFSSLSFIYLDSLYLARFLNNGIEIIDVNSLEIIKTMEWDYSIDVIKYFDDSFYIFLNNEKIIKCDLYNLSDFIYETNYYVQPNELNETIHSWKKEIKRTDCKTLGSFTSTISGTYTTYYIYDDVRIIGKMHVLDYENVTDGLIYPKNYKLEFTGEAILKYKGESETIYNYHEITKSGDYELEIVNRNGEKRYINFKIGENSDEIYQIPNKISDYEIKVNNYISYNIDVRKDNIKYILINNEEYDDYILKENSHDSFDLIIKLYAKSEGINHYNIEKIVFEDEILKINKDIDIMGLKKDLYFDVNIYDDNKYLYVDCNNCVNENMRYLYLEIFENNKLLKKEVYELKNEKINLNNYKGRDISINLGIGYDDNSYEIKEKEVFNLNYSGVDEEEITLVIVKKEENLEDFEIKLKKTSSMDDLKINDNTIYSCEYIDYTNTIMICVLIFILSIGLSFFMQKKLKNKKY